MNAPVLLAQLSGSPQASPSPKNLKLEKPQNGQAVSVHLDGNTKLDFADVASEKLTFVRVGEKLIILFDNQSTVTVDPVFDQSGKPLTDLAFDMGQDRTLTGDQFAQLFPITTDQSVLPAAGGATGPTGGANFSAASVSALGAVGNPLDLLVGEDGNPNGPNNNQDAANVAPIANASSVAIINEDALTGGNPGGAGDTGGALVFTGSLNVDFGSDAGGRQFQFGTSQPTALSGLTSDGQAVHLLVTTLGGLPTLIGYVGDNANDVASRVFTVSLDNNPANGEYTFTLLRPLDHPLHGAVEDTLNLTINVIAIDGSGDAVPTTIQVGINDDTPVIGTTAAAALTDPLSGATATQTGSLGISWGSDRYNDHVDGGVSGTTGGTGDRSVVFASTQVTVSGSTGGASTGIAALTSHGDVVHYVLLANGTALVGYTGDTAPTALPTGTPAGNIVFIATLSDASDSGSYVITQYQALDHVSGNQTFSSINLSFQFTATDSDGDPVSGTLTASIADTLPTLGAAVAQHTVGEDGLANANPSGPAGGFDAVDTASATGTLNVNWGADNDTRGEGDTFGRTLSFLTGGATPTAIAGSSATVGSLNLAISGEAGEALTSGGVALQYVVTANADGGETLTAYRGAPGEGNAVFTLVLDPTSANGSYTFVLLGELDHATDSNSVGLTFTVQAADADGDTINTNFTVNVQDDVPTTGTAVAAQTVGEDGLNGANPTGPEGGFDAVDNATLTGIALNINWGADNDTRGTIDGDTFGRTLSFLSGGETQAPLGVGITSSLALVITGENGAALTSGGVALQYVVTVNADGGETLTAYKGTPGEGNDVFRLTLDPTSAHGSYNFELLGELDHASNSNSIGLTFTVQAADADGDTINTSFTVNVQDDVPTVGTAVAAQNVGEDGLAGANPTGPEGGFDAVNNASLTGIALNINWGADSDTRGAGDSYGRTLSFLSGDGTQVALQSGAASSLALVITGENGAALTSGGVALQYMVSVDADGGETLTAYRGAPGESNAVFTLKLDPTAANGSYSFELLGELDHASNSNSIGLTFTVQAADADGDTINTSFTVNVQDDVPTVGTAVAAQNVGEDGLAGANPTGPEGGFDAVNNASLTGIALNINWGADNDTRGSGDSYGRTLSFLSGGETQVALQAGAASSLALIITGEKGAALTSGGVALQYMVSVDADGGETLTAYRGAPGESNAVFTLKLDPTAANGSYSFELLGELDHASNSNSIGLTFTVQAADADGDTINTSFTVNVQDDVPTVGTAVAAQNVGEDGLAGANPTLPVGSYDAVDNTSLTGIALNINWGADNDTRGSGDTYGRTLSFNLSGGKPVDAQGNALSLTSDGSSLSYILTNLANGGQELLAYKTGTNANNAANQVFRITLDATAEHGAYSFTLLGNLDHVGGAANNDLSLNFGLTATDADGDTVATNFTVHVQDDLPVAGVGTGVTLAEDDVSAYQATDNTPAGNPSIDDTTKTASLNISWGADNSSARSVAFASATASSNVHVSGAFDGSSLTSDGLTVKYVIVGGMLYGYTGNTHGSNPPDGQVFTVSLDDSGNGSYTFHLIGNLDHAAGGGENNLTLTFDYTAKDSDGDAASNTFTVTVKDDQPVIGTPEHESVNEDDLPNGTDFFKESTTQNGNLHISWGADANDNNNGGGHNNRNVAFTGDSAPGGLKSDGVQLVYSYNNDHTVLTATKGANGAIVFTVTLDDDGSGSYSFHLVGNLDHPTGNGQNSTDLSFNFTATDSDGDTTAPATFVVTVVDDVPQLDGVVSVQTVGEDGLPGANQTGGSFDAVNNASKTGALNVDWGADDDTRTGAGDLVGRTLSFLTSGGSAIAGGSNTVSNLGLDVIGENGTTLKSGGVALQYVVTANVDGGETLTAYKGSPANGDKVFTLTLDPTSDHGSYTFTLLGELDHASNSNSIGLTFSVQAADADGDTVNTGFTVNVQDDVPTVTGSVTAQNVGEDGLSGANLTGPAGSYDAVNNATTSAVALNVNWGADNDKHTGAGDLVGRTLSFLKSDGSAIAGGSGTVSNLGLDVTGENGTTLKSGGVALQYVVTANVDGGETLTAYKGSPANGDKVFTLVLDPTSDHGSYTFTLLGELDHASNSNSIGLTFSVQAADADGDTVNTGFTVNVQDDVPTVTGSVTAQNVGEDGLSGANLTGPAGSYDAVNNTTTSAVALNVNWGADNDKHTGAGDLVGRTLSFLKSDGSAIAGGSNTVSNLGLDVTGENGTTLKSGGVALQYVVTANVDGGETLTAYKGSPANGDKVFTLVLDPTSDHGSYTFTLLGELDHASNSNSIGLTFSVQAADADGDTVNTGFTVNVQDDIPTVTGSVTAQNVGEDGLSGANLTGPAGSYDAVNNTTLTGIALNVNWGADNDIRVNGDTYGRTLSFNLSGSKPVDAQGNVLSLTSDGTSLSYIVTDLANGGQELLAYKTGTNAGNAANQVFRITLDPTAEHGAYSFTLLGNLDHTGGAANNDLSLTLALTATDADGDTVGTNFTVHVQDDLPVAGVGTGVTLAEDDVSAYQATDNTPAGNPSIDDTTKTASLNVSWGADDSSARSVAFTSTTAASNVHVSGAFGGTTLTSDGLTVKYVIVGGTLYGYTGDTHGSNPPDGQVFTVSLDDSNAGSYTFHLIGNLDHAAGGGENNLTLTFDYTAKDSDGDAASSTFTVTVKDDQPVIGTPEAASVNEDDLPNGNDLSKETTTKGGDLHVSWGADNNNSGSNQRSVAFSGDVAPTGLTSDGVQLVYGYNTDKTVLTATRGVGGATVFTVTLSDQDSGSYSFKLLGNLDHANGAGQNSLGLTFNFTATDSDGDTTAPAGFTVTVIDDVPTIGTTDSKTVIESTANGGLSNAFVSSTATGSLAVHWGADDNNPVTGAHDRTLQFAASLDHFVSTLTSNGETITYTLSNGGTLLTATASSGGLYPTLRTVFTVSLDDSAGNYTFTQLDNLDHAAPATPGAVKNDLAITFGFTATDSDGDAATSSFTVHVTDDVPVVLAAADTASINEVALTTGSLVNTNTSGSLHIDWNADDKNVHLAFASTTVKDGNGNVLSLKSNGVALDYIVRLSGNGHDEELVAFKHGDTLGAGNPVFIVTLNGPGNAAYAVTLYQNLDHPGAGADTLSLHFTVNAFDGDGDSVQQTFAVDIVDSVPTAGTQVAATLDDDALAGGNAGGIGDDHGVASTGGVLIHDYKADGAGTLLLTGAGLPTTSSAENSFSQTLSSDGLTLTVYQIQGGVSVDVMTVHLADASSGAYTVTLDHAIRHAAGGDENNALFSIGYQVKDFDGDTVPGTLNISVDDDTPVIAGTTTQVNLLTNGDFSGGIFAHTESWGQWATEDTGWKITGTQTGQTGVQLERVASGYEGVVTSNGHPMVDLAASPGDIAISQTVSGLPVGQHYTLSFEIGASNPSSAGLEVYWNGVLVHTYQPTGTMTVQTLDLIAAAGDNSISFKEVGSAGDNTGTYLANVSLVQAGQGALPIFHADIGEDGASVVTLADGPNFTFGADGPGAVAFDTAHATISTPTGTTLSMPALSYDPVTGKLTVDPGWGFGGLSEGEIATLSVPFTVTDSDGDTKTGVYQFTIHGSNDPVSTSPGFPDSGIMTEYAETDLQAGSTADRTRFTDSSWGGGYNGGGFWIYDDQGDTHTLTVTANGAGYIGYLTAVVSQETVNDGNGFVDWTYHVTDAAMNYLSAGETKVETFTILVSDGHGSSTTRDIQVTLVGTEDRPDIFVGQNDSSAVSLHETNSTLSANGTLTVVDPDHLDVVKASVTGVAWTLSSGTVMYSDAGLLAMFHVAPGTVLPAGDTRSASLAWTFNSNGNAFNFLGEGVTATLVYTVQVTDGLETDTQQVTVTITGTNDAPVLVGETNPAGINELLDASAQDILITGGTITVSDADRGDTLHPTVTGDAVATWSGGTLPAGVNIASLIAASAVHFSADQQSNAGARSFDWSYDPAAANLDWLAQGQTLTVTYQAQVGDGLASAGTTLTITITGTNDAPVITSAASAAQGSLSEAGDLSSIHSAGIGGALQVDPALAGNATVVGALQTLDGHLATLPSQANIHDALATIAGVSNTATAFAVVWQHLDAIYGAGGASQTNLNAAFTELGLEYAAYLRAGGSPLVDVVAKYIADGGDADTTPDRSQSLHDNLLGNLTDYALHQRYDATPALYQQMHDLVAANDASLLTRTSVGGYESDAPGSAASAHATDMQNGYAAHVSGQLTATDADTGATQAWSITGPSTYGTMTIDAHGKWTYTLDDKLPATEMLAQGESVTQTFTATVTDDHGATDTVQVTVTINGTNDAPVITSGAANASVTLFESGVLHNVVTADVAADHKFEPAHNVDATAAASIGAGVNTEADMKGVVTAVQAALGTGATFADAIASVWDYLDDNYTYYNGPVNKAGVLLALVYADYLQHGGMPLVDVVVKYGVDGSLGYINGGVTDGIPDRVQSLHDNLLGAVDTPSINDKFSSDPTLLADLKIQIAQFGLTDRPIYSGEEGKPDNALAWDQAHGFLPSATGQLTAVDVDHGAVMTWSINGPATYGVMTIDASTGIWSYTLDNSLTATQALAEGQTVTQSYTATVTDEHGATANQTVTVTIHGTNDAPVINYSFTEAYASPEDTVVHLTQDQLNWFIATYVSDPDNSNASLTYTYSIGGQSITFTGSAPADGFTFTPDANFHGTLQGYFSVSDGMATTTKTFTYDVTAVNDAPTLSHVATVGTAEDTTLYLKTAGWVAGDVDKTDGVTPLVTLTLHITSGEGVLNVFTGGLSGQFDITSSADGKTLTITTHADGGNRDAYDILNSLLRGDNFADDNKNGIAFKPAHDFSGTVEISYTIDDHGSFGAAGTSTSSGSFDIDVRPVTDAITLAASSGDEDTAIAVHIAIGDIDGSEKATHIELTGFPTGATFNQGALVGGVWVIDNAAGVDVAHLTMTPPSNYNGNFNLGVSVTVVDSATLSDGVHTDTATTAGTIAVTVNSVDDAPTDITLSNLAVAPGATGAVATVTVSDVDDTAFTFVVRNPNGSVSTDLSVTGTPGDYHLVVSSGGVTTLPPTVLITATDSGGLSYTEAFALTLPIQLFNASHQLIATFATIQAAVNGAHDGAGEYIMVPAGTYNENVTINKGVDIVGAEHGIAGDDAARIGASESVINGQWTIDTTHAVKIDGLYFNNTSPSGTTGDATLSVLQGGDGAGHVITDTIFNSAVAGGDKTTHDDRAIYVGIGAGTGHVTIDDNLITGASVGKYDTASWGRGVWADVTDGIDLTISDNTFHNVRSALNLDDYGATNPSLHVTGNDFTDTGTAVALGVNWSGDISALLHANSFDNVDQEINIKGLSHDVTLDAGAGVAGYTDTTVDDAVNDAFYISGGSGADTITGTDFVDVIEGLNGNDTIKGGKGDDVIFGGAGIDTAKYDATLQASQIAANGVGGWTVTTGTSSEGTDSLFTTEIVQGAGTHKFLLVGNGGFATIQAAVDAASAGDTILIAAGTYSGNIVVDKALTIIGSGAGTIIHGTFLTDNNITGTVEAFLQNASSYNANAGAGFTVAADNVSISNLSITGFNVGIELNGGAANTTLDTTAITNVAISGVIDGIHKTDTAGVNGLTITGGSITDGHIGIDFAKSVTTSDGYTTHVTITGTSFSHLTEKGIYVESFDQSTISNIKMTDVGEIGRTAAFGLASQLGDFGAGIDINLKNGSYTGIVIDGFTFINVGEANSGGHGIGIGVKVRNDGTTYGGAPATYSGDVTIENGTITGTSTGVRIGEPGQSTTGINVDLTNVAITGAHYDGDNATTTTLTVTMPAGVDSLFLTNPATTIGAVIVHGNDLGDTIATGGGADTVFGGVGNDIITGGKGDDVLHGGAGNDTFIYTVGDGADRIDGGSETGATNPNYDILQFHGDAEARTITIGKLPVADAGNIVPTTGTDSPDVTVTYTGTNGTTIRADEIEHIDIIAGSGGLTVNIGDVAGTAILPTTITVTGGAGDDVVDLSGLQGDIHVVFDGNGGNDKVVLGNVDWKDAVVTDNNGTYTVTVGGHTYDITNVESFQFQNGTATAAQVIEAAPTDITAGALSVAENSVNGTVVGSVAGVDGNGSIDALSYGFVVNGNVSQTSADGRFTINALTGQITVANGSLLDYETATSHNETVRVTDSHGQFYSEVVTIGVTNVNDAPVFGSGTTSGAVTEDASYASFTPSELIQNGKFDANISGLNWTTTGTVFYVNSGGTHSSAAMFNQTTTDPSTLTLSQSITTVVGQTYTLTFDLSDNGAVQTAPGYTPAYITVGATGSAANSIGLINDSAYHTYTYQFTATSTTTTVLFSAPPFAYGSIYVDNISVLSNGPTPGIETASGTIAFTDQDVTDSHTVSVSTPAGSSYYGTFNATVDNATNKVNWTFSVNDSAIQSLGTNDHINQTYTLTLSDGHGGSVTENVTVTVNGANDAASITGTATGTVKEDGTLTAGGTLSVSDVDHGENHFQTPASLAGTYGSFTFDASTGVWGYTLNNNASNVQALTGSQTVHDTLTVTSADGTATQQINVTINGTDEPVVNHAPVFGTGTTTGAVTEDASLVASAGNLIQNGSFGYYNGNFYTLNGWTQGGAKDLTIAGGHTDGGALGFDGTASSISQTIATVVGTTYTIDFYSLNYGSALTVSANGTTVGTTAIWVYQDWTEATYQFTATSTSTVVTFMASSLVYLDDISVTAASTGTPGIEAAAGAISFTDVDAADTHTVTYTTPAGSNYYGTFNATVDNTADKVKWTFSVNDSAIQSLGANDHINQTYTLTLSDGHGGTVTKDVTVTVNGVNDAASISGTATGAVKEDGTLTAGGTLAVSDVDNGESHFQTLSSLTGIYGTFTFNATTGVWGYTLNNSAANVQALTGSQTVHDTITVVSADGTASQVIDVTISGTNEPVSAPSISQVADDVGSIKGNLADGAVTDDTQLAVRVSLTGTNAVVGDTVQLYNGTSALGSSFTLTASMISKGYVDITTPTLSNGSTYNFRASITDAGVTTALSASGAYDIKIDTTKPNVAVTQTLNSTNKTGTFTFTFSEAVTGFDSSDISYGNKISNLGALNHVGINGSGQDVYTQTFSYSSSGSSGRSATVGTGYADLAGNSGVGASTSFPAGVSGEAINLALSTPAEHVGSMSLTIAGLAAGWVLSEGTHNADGTWSVVTSDPSSLSVTSPDGHTGAVVLQVSETWTDSNGVVHTSYVADNVEAYAKGAPIFAWSGDDTLTASSGDDTLVFANKIGNDVVHHFDAAHDKIDLIGFAGFSSFADVQAHLSTDASGNAVLTLADGQTITLTGVTAAQLTASDFLFNEAVVTHNTGDMVLSDGSLMPFSGTLDNSGHIHLASTGSDTAFEIVQHGLTLLGGGTVTMSDNASNVIFGSADDVTLTNVDNTISGAGHLGDGHLTLVNEGTIVADGSNALVIDTGDNAIVNSGTLEASASGGLDVHSDLVNNGVVWANGANVDLEGNVSGSGSALLSGHASLELGGSFEGQVSFDGSAQGTLVLDHADDFHGMLSGFDGNDTIDLTNILGSSASANYAENAQGTGGVLTVTDGAHTANIAFSGQYATADFHIGTDVNNHVLVQLEQHAQQLNNAA